MYSRFLKTLLDKYYTTALRREVGAREQRDTPDGGRTPPARFSWPDTGPQRGTPPSDGDQERQSPPFVQERDGEPEMDFSLSHFVQSAMPPTNTVQQDPTYQWQVPAPTSSVVGAYTACPVETVETWQHPFNYAAMLDMAYSQYHLQGR